MRATVVFSAVVGSALKVVDGVGSLTLALLSMIRLRPCVPTGRSGLCG